MGSPINSMNHHLYIGNTPNSNLNTQGVEAQNTLDSFVNNG
jgi:hypothetical protein